MKKKIKRLKLTLIIFISLFILGGGYHESKDIRVLQAHSASCDNALSVMVGAWAKSQEPKPTPTLDQSDQIEVFGQYLFRENWQLMRKIIACESGWRTNAVSSTNDSGLFQINAVHGIRQDWLKNWRVNMVIAYELYQRSGVNPWNSSRHCWGAK